MKTFWAKHPVLTTTVISTMATFGMPAHALQTEEAKSAVGTNISTQENLTKTAFTVIQWILGIAFLAAVAMLILGGFRYITSAGNDKQADAAKETLTNAVIGLVFILLAYVIASTINQVLLGKAPTA